MSEDEGAVRSHTQFCAGCKVSAFAVRSFPALPAKFLKFSAFFFSNIVPVNWSSLDFCQIVNCPSLLFVNKHNKSLSRELVRRVSVQCWVNWQTNNT